MSRAIAAQQHRHVKRVGVVISGRTHDSSPVPADDATEDGIDVLGRSPGAFGKTTRWEGASRPEAVHVAPAYHTTPVHKKCGNAVPSWYWRGGDARAQTRPGRSRVSDDRCPARERRR